MRNTDEMVDKVLAGLRDVEPSAGFEERMERRVREAARVRGASGWFGVWQWVGVGCVAMLLVGVGVSLRRQDKQDVVATNDGVRREARGQTGADGVGEVEEGVSQRLKPRHRLRDYGTAEAVPLSKTSFLSRTNSSRDVRSSEIAGAQSDGFPAPPLPLTAQERLLLRAAVGGDPMPVAVLEVSVLPTHDAEETAEFVEFFGQDRQVEQSKPGESE